MRFDKIRRTLIGLDVEVVMVVVVDLRSKRREFCVVFRHSPEAERAGREEKEGEEIDRGNRERGNRERNRE